MTISFNTLGEFGRLGNQMFQYAFLLGLHSKYGYDIAIPSSDFKNAWRQHQLFQAFKLKSLKKENIIRIDRDNFIREKQFHFDEDIFNNAPDGTEAIFPAYLFAFIISAAIIRNSHFVYTAAATGDLSCDFRFEAKALFPY